MTPEEHIQTMDEFVRDSQNIFTDGGNRLVAHRTTPQLDSGHPQCTRLHPHGSQSNKPLRGGRRISTQNLKLPRAGGDGLSHGRGLKS